MASLTVRTILYLFRCVFVFVLYFFLYLYRYSVYFCVAVTVSTNLPPPSLHGASKSKGPFWCSAPLLGLPQCTIVTPLLYHHFGPECRGWCSTAPLLDDNSGARSTRAGSPWHHFQEKLLSWSPDQRVMEHVSNSTLFSQQNLSAWWEKAASHARAFLKVKWGLPNTWS